MKTVLITGGTGLVGKHLTNVLLQNNYAVIVLTRNKNLLQRNKSSQLNYAYWNVEENLIDENVFAKTDFIVHLAGASIAEKRWTKKRKKELVDSRINSSKLLVNTLVKVPNKVQAVISASAIGWYDSSLNKTHTEDELHAKDFLGDTCKAWEESIEPVNNSGIRLVKLRLGIVLSKEGGMLKELSKPLKFGFAPVFGRGKQIISWLSIDDLCNMFLFAIENNKLSGVYNAVAPQPLTQIELTTDFAKSENGKMFIRFYIPSFVLKLMLGEMSIEILKSSKVSFDKIIKAGFEFKYENIYSALG